MDRGTPSFKKTEQFPKVKLDTLDRVFRDPELIKQPYHTNQPYQPTAFGNTRTKEAEFLKKSG